MATRPQANQQQSARQLRRRLFLAGLTTRHDAPANEIHDALECILIRALLPHIGQDALWAARAVLRGQPIPNTPVDDARSH